MQEARIPNSSRQANLRTTALHHTLSIFTPKRVGYTVAGAFVFIGSAMVLHGTNNNLGDNAHAASQDNYTAPPSSAAPAGSSASSESSDTTPSNDPGNTTHTYVSTNTSSGAGTKSHLSVNGKDVPLPDNGTTHQTITDSQGTSQTDIDTYSSTTTDDPTNSSSSNLSISIQSNSTTTGGSDEAQ